MAIESESAARPSRRQFLGTALGVAVTAGFPAIVPA